LVETFDHAMGATASSREVASGLSQAIADVAHAATGLRGAVRSADQMRRFVITAQRLHREATGHADAAQALIGRLRALAGGASKRLQADPADSQCNELERVAA
jgi:hypothetical protein